MHRLAIPSLTLAAALVLLVGFATIAPPETGGRAGPDSKILAGDRCVIAPRPVSELISLGWSPALGLVIPSARPLPNPWIQYGEFGADNTEATDEVWSVVRMAASCRAVGNAPRFYALYTDEFLRIGFGSAPLAEPREFPAMPDMPIWAGSWRIADDRLGAVFYTPQSTGRSPDRGRPVWFIFERREGRWLIDDAVPFANGS